MLLAHIAAAVFFSFTFIFRSPHFSSSLSLILSLARLSSGPSQYFTEIGLFLPSSRSALTAAPICALRIKSTFSRSTEDLCYLDESSRPQLYQLLYGVEPSPICLNTRRNIARAILRQPLPFTGWKLFYTGAFCCAFAFSIVFFESNRGIENHDDSTITPANEELHVVEYNLPEDTELLPTLFDIVFGVTQNTDIATYEDVGFDFIEDESEDRSDTCDLERILHTTPLQSPSSNAVTIEGGNEGQTTSETTSSQPLTSAEIPSHLEICDDQDISQISPAPISISIVTASPSDSPVSSPTIPSLMSPFSCSESSLNSSPINSPLCSPETYPSFLEANEDFDYNSDVIVPKLTKSMNINRAIETQKDIQGEASSLVLDLSKVTLEAVKKPENNESCIGVHQILDDDASSFSSEETVRPVESPSLDSLDEKDFGAFQIAEEPLPKASYEEIVMECKTSEGFQEPLDASFEEVVSVAEMLDIPEHLATVEHLVQETCSDDIETTQIPPTHEPEPATPSVGEPFIVTHDLGPTEDSCTAERGDETSPEETSIGTPARRAHDKTVDELKEPSSSAFAFSGSGISWADMVADEEVSSNNSVEVENKPTLSVVFHSCCALADNAFTPPSWNVYDWPACWTSKSRFRPRDSDAFNKSTRFAVDNIDFMKCSGVRPSVRFSYQPLEKALEKFKPVRVDCFNPRLDGAAQLTAFCYGVVDFETPEQAVEAFEYLQGRRVALGETHWRLEFLDPEDQTCGGRKHVEKPMQQPQRRRILAQGPGSGEKRRPGTDFRAVLAATQVHNSARKPRA